MSVKNMKDDYRQIILDALPEFNTQLPQHAIRVNLVEDAGEYFLVEFFCGVEVFHFAYNRRITSWYMSGWEGSSSQIKACKAWINWSLTARLISIDDIYAAPVIREEKGIYLLTRNRCNNLPELPDDFDPEQDRVKIKIHYDPPIDGSRCCTVGSVWFDDSPVMVFRHAGRSGHDEYDRFVSDKARFSQMVDFLRSLLTLEEANEVEEIDPSKPLLELTEFYGYWLDFQEENRGD